MAWNQSYSRFLPTKQTSHLSSIPLHKYRFFFPPFFMHVTCPRMHSLLFTKGGGGMPSGTSLGGLPAEPRRAGRTPSDIIQEHGCVRPKWWQKRRRSSVVQCWICFVHEYLNCAEPTTRVIKGMGGGGGSSTLYNSAQ